MTKIDFKKTLKPLYAPSAKDFVVVNVPTINFIKVDGAGPPGNQAYTDACGWLYPISYGLKFMSKITLEQDYVVPPLEGLWWANDMTAYTDDRRDEWLWTLMIMVPDWITNDMYAQALETAATKLGSPPATLRLEAFTEGKSVQILHIGPFSEEGPTLARLHNEYMPAQGLDWNSNHHEIYLSDPRRTAPEKLKTVLRQPVKSV
ncbi:GyrI-like domain-containing protein [Planktotalea sp.]|uniref:GyrI-like domain-containing protein n=1 Tax=Planktotalea sp. TaxID=2029877 RepID=UPI0025F0021B|nr:GyrI-like domain-containing protein [Planktotalea sp.]